MLPTLFSSIIFTSHGYSDVILLQDKAKEPLSIAENPRIAGLQGIPSFVIRIQNFSHSLKEASSQLKMYERSVEKPLNDLEIKFIAHSQILSDAFKNGTIGNAMQGLYDNSLDSADLVVSIESLIYGDIMRGLANQIPSLKNRHLISLEVTTWVRLAGSKDSSNAFKAIVYKNKKECESDESLPRELSALVSEFAIDYTKSNR